MHTIPSGREICCGAHTCTGLLSLSLPCSSGLCIVQFINISSRGFDEALPPQFYYIHHIHAEVLLSIGDNFKTRTLRWMPFLSNGASMLKRDIIGRILSKESTTRICGCSLLYSFSSSSHSVIGTSKSHMSNQNLQCQYKARRPAQCWSCETSPTACLCIKDSDHNCLTMSGEELMYFQGYR